MIILITESQREKLVDNIFGQRVMVYYNLHKHTFSVQKSGLVLLHADYLKLKNVEFRVRKGGLERVRREKSKNVHAFVIGEIEDYCEFPCYDLPSPPSEIVATYNPYEYETFVVKSTKEPIFHAEKVEMINDKNKIYIV